MTHRVFRTPPTLLTLTEGGGSRICDKICADMDGPEMSTLIHGPIAIPDPPVHSAFNGGGGSGMSIKEHSKIYVLETGAQINSLERFSDPP
jgi:hypothetical protein